MCWSKYFSRVFGKYVKNAIITIIFRLLRDCPNLNLFLRINIKPFNQHQLFCFLFLFDYNFNGMFRWFQLFFSFLMFACLFIFFTKTLIFILFIIIFFFFFVFFGFLQKQLTK